MQFSWNIIYIQLNDQQQFRLKKINKLMRLKEENWWAKELSKYIASFDHFDKSLIVLSVTTGSIFIASVLLEQQ